MRILVCFCFLLGSIAPAFAQARIKDITNVQGVKEVMLVGYGLVVGLNGTGDTPRNSVFTRQSVRTMLERLGVGVAAEELRTKNVAAVVVTAAVKSFISRGSKIDVTVSSLGDAKSLMGGSLLMTPLLGANGTTYAVAQGQVTVLGFQAGGQNATVTQGVPTTGRIANGALVEKANKRLLRARRSWNLNLINPDAKTVISVTDAINQFSLRRYNMKIAREKSMQSVALMVPPKTSWTRLLSQIGSIRITPDVSARIVIDPRSGTVVMGRSVQISTVAVTHGNLTVRVTETPVVTQPNPLGRGKTVVVPHTTIEAKDTGGHFTAIGGRNLATLIKGLNQVGIKPAGIIAILQAMKTAGAIQAELVVQ